MFEPEPRLLSEVSLAVEPPERNVIPRHHDARQFPVADGLFEGLVSLPGYPRMTEQDVEDVIEAVHEIVIGNRVKVRVAAAS